MKSSDQSHGEPTPPTLGLFFLAWLIPGSGFWLRRQPLRGTVQFLMVIVTFGLGLSLHGGVDWPSWSMSDEGFNLIHNFTFIVQLGAGLPALLSLYAQYLPGSLLIGVPSSPYYELGGYYLIVSGAINYFAVCNLYDRSSIHWAERTPTKESDGNTGKEPDGS